MKRFKSTFIFGSLVLALGVYVFWDFTEQKLGADLEPGEVLLAEFDQSKVSAVKIIREDGEVDLDFSQGDCRIMAPQSEECDNDLVKSFFRSLSLLKGKEILSANDIKARESDFGLDQGSTELAWKLTSGEEGRIRIGSKNSFDGGFYVVKGALFLVSKDAGQLVNKGFAEFRSKNPWTVNEALVQDISVSSSRFSQGKYKLKKLGSSWSLVKPGFEVDEEKVNEWLKNLGALKGSHVSDEAPKGLKDKAFSIQLDERQYDFFSLNGEIYARSLNKKRYVLVPMERLKKIFVHSGYFYKGTTPFQFPLERASQVEYSNGGKKQVVVKEDQEWVLKEKPTSFKDHRLSEFFQTLSGLNAKMTSEKWSEKDFSSKDQIVIKDSDGKILFEMKWAEVKRLKEGPYAEESLRPVKLPGGVEGLAVSQYQLQNLLDIDFTEEVKSLDSHQGEFDHDHDHHH